MQNDIPEELDWIKARAECSLEILFSGLKREVEADVNKQNERVGQKRFSIHFNDNNFTVLCGDGGGPRSVVFFLSQKQIEVKDGNMKPMFEAAFTLNDA